MSQSDSGWSVPNPANKTSSIEYGDEKEIEFVTHIAPLLEIDAIINPEKKTDSTVIDLLVEGELCDLKTRRTPYYHADSKYGIDSQYAVTFNKNKFERYQKYNDNILLLFWVNWEKLKDYGVTLDKMSGIWITSVKEVKEIYIQEKEAPIHEYTYRNEYDNHANKSYVLDLRWMTPITTIMNGLYKKEPDEKVISEYIDNWC